MKNTVWAAPGLYPFINEVAIGVATGRARQSWLATGSVERAMRGARVCNPKGSTRGVCDPKGAESPGNGPGKGPGSKSVISIAFRFQFGTLPQAPHSLTRGVRGSVD